MVNNPEPTLTPVSGRASVPENLIYMGELPATEEPPSALSDNQWRNIAVTLSVVLVAASAAVVIFWPRGEGVATLPPVPIIQDQTDTPTAAPSVAPTGPLLFSGPPRSGVAIPSGDLPGWKQTFTDDFNGADLSQRWFIYDGQPAGDPGGYFKPSHVSQDQGSLVISGFRDETPNGRIYATGGISNSKDWSQVYGKFEFRFRMDAGYGINYILMLWPTDDEWPPEINIAEDNGKSRSLITSTLHYRGSNGRAQYMTRHKDGIDFTQWHTVGAEWTPGKIVYYLDGVEWAKMQTTSVPKTPMSIAIQSQAWFCGGNFSDCPNSSTPAKVNLEVDWVVAYAAA